MNSYIRAVLNCRNSALDSKPFTGELEGAPGGRCVRQEDGTAFREVRRCWGRELTWSWMYLASRFHSQSSFQGRWESWTCSCGRSSCSRLKHKVFEGLNSFYFICQRLAAARPPRSGLCSPLSPRTWGSYECIRPVSVEPCKVFPSVFGLTNHWSPTDYYQQCFHVVGFSWYLPILSPYTHRLGVILLTTWRYVWFKSLFFLCSCIAVTSQQGAPALMSLSFKPDKKKVKLSSVLMLFNQLSPWPQLTSRKFNIPRLINKTKSPQNMTIKPT